MLYINVYQEPNEDIGWKIRTPSAGRISRQGVAFRTCGAEHPATVYAGCGVNESVAGVWGPVVHGNEHFTLNRHEADCHVATLLAMP